MPGSEAAAPEARGLTARQGLPLAGLAVGVWAILPPYVGPGVATESDVEVVDHVVPAVVVLALAVAAVALGRQASRESTWLLASGLGVTLAGIWMVATHVPLVAQATRNEVEWLPVAHHSLPGLAVATLGLIWTAAHWRQAPT